MMCETCLGKKKRGIRPMQNEQTHLDAIIMLVGKNGENVFCPQHENKKQKI